MQMNNEFKLLLTIEDCVEDEGKRIPSLMSVNQFSMIEMLGNTTKKESEAGQSSISLDHCYTSSVSLYTDFVLHNVPTD